MLTSHDLPDEAGVTIVHSLKDFLADMAAAGKNVWNGSIHDDVEPDEIYITRIHANYDCDKFYPMQRLQDFQLLSSEPGKPKTGEPNYTFEVYAHSRL
ncbi:dihydrofolate reductase [Candidatus Saccharibacteria bacterium]|nr:MAG: dihydrofolate reductase [Candidatus Saccharibacteria bacterium]